MSSVSKSLYLTVREGDHDDEEEDEEEEEEEPKLKFERLAADVRSLLAEDKASTVAVSDKLILVATAGGKVHALDALGHLVTGVASAAKHSSPVSFSLACIGEVVRRGHGLKDQRVGVGLRLLQYQACLGPLLIHFVQDLQPVQAVLGSFEKRSFQVVQVSLDHTGEFFSSCSQDGLVVLRGMADQYEADVKTGGRLSAAAIDPIFGRSGSGRRFMTGENCAYFLLLSFFSTGNLARRS